MAKLDYTRDKPTQRNAQTQGDAAVLEALSKPKRPPFFKVVLLNDDYTPMEFVVQVLKDIFRHAHEEAISLMLQVHHRGAATVGVYTRDVAETKAEMVINQARMLEYPLQCVLEKE